MVTMINGHERHSRHKIGGVFFGFIAQFRRGDGWERSGRMATAPPMNAANAIAIAIGLLPGFTRAALESSSR